MHTPTLQPRDATDSHLKHPKIGLCSAKTSRNSIRGNIDLQYKSGRTPKEQIPRRKRHCNPEFTMTTTGSVKHLEDNKVEIHTSRLILRPAQPSDAEQLNPAFGDPKVMRYWSEPPHKDVERTKEWIDKMTKAEQNGLTDFIITLEPESTPIGKIGVWQGDEIGFLLARQHWGKGLAKEALSSILPYLFKEENFEALTADIDPRNAASRRILEKMGFVEYEYKERTAEIGGEWVDSVYLRLTKERWEGSGIRER